MSRETLEQLRVPVGLLLLAMVAFALWPRGGEAEPSAAPSASPSVIAGEVGGGVFTPSPEPTPVPTVATPEPTEEPTPEPTQEPTPDPTPAPPPPDGFSAEVLACRSISGSTCNDQLGTLPASGSTFTALVRFTSARAGDTMNVVLDGPSGRIDGFPYALQGGGNGYYYSQFQSSGLPGGTYTLTALRNGDPVATTSFRKAGN